MLEPTCFAAVAEYRFPEPLAPFVPPEVVLNRTLLGKEPSEVLDLARRMQFRIPEERVVIIVEGRKWAIIHRDGGDAAGYASVFARNMQRGREIFGGSNVERLGVRTHWVAPLDMSFDEAARQFASNMFTFSSPEGAFDYGASADVRLPKERIAHLRMGPMDQKQLATMMAGYMLDDLPAVSLFIDVDYAEETSRRENPGHLERFVRDAFDYAQGVARNMAEQFERGGLE